MFYWLSIGTCIWLNMLIQYSMNLFLVTYGASCAFVDAFHAQKTYSNGQHIHVGQVWTTFLFGGVSRK